MSEFMMKIYNKLLMCPKSILYKNNTDSDIL